MRSYAWTTLISGPFQVLPGRLVVFSLVILFSFSCNVRWCDAAGRAAEPTDTQLRQAERARAAVRAATAELVRSGGFIRIMAEHRMAHGYPLWIDFDDLQHVAEALIKAAGPAAAKALSAAREVATLLAIQHISEVYQQRKKQDDRIIDVKQKKKFQQLVQKSLRGFANLSNPHAFLEKKAMTAKANTIIRQAYALENVAVQKALAQEVHFRMQNAAAQAKKEFRVVVRYTLFGTKGFGTRDRYLKYPTHTQRQQAIEDALYRQINSHPKFRHAAVRTAYITSLVTQHAKKLANTIRGVPGKNQKR